MPRSFPDMQSLVSNAKARKYREPFENETEESYRTNFANWMRNVDPVESLEIRNGVGWDKQNPLGMLIDLMGSKESHSSGELNIERIHTTDGKTIMMRAPEVVSGY